MRVGLHLPLSNDNHLAAGFAFVKLREDFVPNKLSPVECLERWRHVTRQWLSVLAPAEIVVICAIMDRTINWSKSTERVTIAHLVTGVEGYSFGTGFDERYIRRIVKQLERRGVLSRSPSGQIFTYELNFEVTRDMLLPVKKRGVKKK